MGSRYGCFLEDHEIIMIYNVPTLSYFRAICAEISTNLTNSLLCLIICRSCQFKHA
jgi:hypothetical protein